MSAMAILGIVVFVAGACWGAFESWCLAPMYEDEDDGP